jgi:radical SAM protein
MSSDKVRSGTRESLVREPWDFSQAPVNVYWETTRACAVACQYCRDEVRGGHPNQLTFQEGIALLRQVREFGDPPPHLILTGGDPLERHDLFDLIDEARRQNIGVSITLATTPALTRDALVRLKEHSIDAVALSLDGSTDFRHDSIRGIPGMFEHTVKAMRWAEELEIPLYVNTLVSVATEPDLANLYHFLKNFRVAQWNLFFLISAGRGKVLRPLAPEDAETLMGWISRTSRVAPFVVATTEAPSYRRVALEAMRQEGMSEEEIRRSYDYRNFGIREGNGIVFVSHVGDICPAGFLPLIAGNVRKDNLVEVYRHASAFVQLHDSKQFEGRCGTCQYRMLCGGSRSRAYQDTGDALEADPLCNYDPKLQVI